MWWEALIKAGAFDTLHPDRASALASIALAFDWAETQAVNANQGGLFDFDDGASHGSHTQEPPLVAAEPWSIRERLMLEKAAIGFYLSGHLFDQDEVEVRKFCRRRIADLIDSREPQLLAGIVSDLRVINGQRGRVGASSRSTTRASPSRLWPTKKRWTPTKSCCATTNWSSCRARCNPIGSVAACA